ncbi:P-loop containing nucleoside triphosphate hydrolase protein [Xylaria grammica]|nr:P-loop containing nucleoside triphosphate hydrolase protein [Xylaria grammica]
MFPFGTLYQTTLSVVRLFLSIATAIYRICSFLPLLLLDYLAIQPPEPAQDQPWLPDTEPLLSIEATINNMGRGEDTTPKISKAKAVPDSMSEKKKKGQHPTDIPASSPNADKEEEPGLRMNVSVKKLYGTTSKSGAITWSEEYPKEIEKSIEERVERRRHSFIVKMVRSDEDDEMERREGDDDFGLRIHSITVQSPVVKRIIAGVLRKYPDISASTEEFKWPFIPFYHRLKSLNQAMKQHVRNDLEDDVAINTKNHLEVFYDILMKGLQNTIDRSQALIDCGRISYKYVWAIFSPGMLVVYQDRIYKVKSLQGSRLKCQYVDWNGAEFGYSEESIYIGKFDGIERITNLNVFPLQSHEDCPNFIVRMKRRGERFVALSGHHYKSYKGIIQEKRKWDGFEGFGSSGSGYVRRTVNHRVVIDAKLYREYNPSPVAYISPLRERNKSRAENEVLEGPDWSIDTAHDHKPESNHTQKGPLSNEELLMCTNVLRGFSLKTKSWAEFQIDSVTDIIWEDMAFKSLVLEQRFKDLIVSVVDSQIMNGHEFDDFIGGKGQGMNMLFSGPPGVGKTLTAESIAEYMRKPLYSIAAGELGLTSSVENNLKKIFKLSIGLDAVVLLDEADVFLQKRSADNLERNALVAVFLRVLEYYRGVLFLTTNQIDSFDPAFLSRIHININFPKLEPAARKLIWSSFLEMSPLENGISSTELDRIATQYVMNGRQIKNAIKTAQLLARRNAQHEVLTAEMIDTVVAITIPGDTTSNGC